jgi:hypothetical protein
MKKQEKLLKFVSENYTKDQQREMKKYCSDNFFRNTCDGCKYFQNCNKINSNYDHCIVNGKKVGYFYLSDLEA